MKNISEIVDKVKAMQSGPKIGKGHAMGMVRKGAKEAAQIFVPLSDSINLQEEYGVFGNALPSEVAEERKGKSDPTQAKSQPMPQKELKPDMELEM